MRKSIALLGSTGSIGQSALRIIRAHPEKFRIRALAAKNNARELLIQAREFRPETVCLFEPEKIPFLRSALKPLRVRVLSGIEGLTEISQMSSVDEAIFAMVGAVGLIPILAAIRAGKQVAIANKEPLVMAGELLVREAARRKTQIFPIDSEHSGLWQCLDGKDRKTIKKLILTSSGGPFRARRGSLRDVKPAEALRHPKWKMGPKITVDSATLMNKGLEVIEAANLFGMGSDRIEVLIHPEAIVHAMVEFVDGSHLAHLAVTDMRLPIQYALSYPGRLDNHMPVLDFREHKHFNFEKPDYRRFPCLELGYEASRAGGSMPAVLNAANEVAVEAFLNGKIGFTEIPRRIRTVMARHRAVKNPGLEALLEADRWARREAEAVR